MNNILKSLCNQRFRISALLTASILAFLLCYINLSIVFVGLVEIIVLAGCIVFFCKVDVTQFELFQYKPNWFWRVCEWYWSLWFSFNYFLEWLKAQYPSLCSTSDVTHPILMGFADFIGQDVYKAYFSNVLFLPIVILTIPVCCCCFRWLFKQIVEFFRSLTRFEICFLAISSIVLAAVLLFVSSITGFFVCPVDRDLYLSESSKEIKYNIEKFNEEYEFDDFGYCDFFFYTDCAPFVQKHNYEKATDSCRHPFSQYVFFFFAPLFYLTALFFSLFYHSFVYCTALAIAIVQILLFVLMGIFLYRLFLPLVNNAFSKLIAVVFVCSFPVVFALCPEKLIFSAFLLVLAAYTGLSESSSLKSFVAQLAAVGATSLSFVPLALINLYNRRNMHSVVILIVVLIVTLCRNFDWIKPNTKSIPERISFSQRLNSYFQLESCCFAVPNHEIIKKDLEIVSSNDKTYLIPSKIIVVSAPSCFDECTGIIVFVLCCLSALTFRQNKVIIVCSFWALLSLIIIGIIGFGISESVLYCSYFSWAIIPLALLPFYWLWQKYPRLPVPQALYLFAAYLAVSNLYFIYQIVQTVSERYIVPPGM